MPTKDTHYTRGRCFNTERANLFSDIKQPAQFSSYLASRNSLLIIPSQLKQFLQVIRITHVGGVLTPKRRTHSAVLNNQLNLARISLLVTRYL